MYERFYELRERPFALSPDPDYLYPSRVHREALDYLRYGLESHAGFVIITGEIGSGKTTLLQTLLRGLDSQTTVARIVNTMLEPRELLETIMIDFGLEPAGKSKPLLLRDLAQYLVDQRLAGRMVLLVIDEAQNLTADALEELRMLSNLETEKSKLLQIVLVGQPNLRDKLGAPELEQLRQRITVSYHLQPLDAGETENYINHRLRRAAVGSPVVFPREATEMIHTRSRGVPRIINIICDAALVFGYAEERRTINLALVQEVLAELELTGVLPAAVAMSATGSAPAAAPVPVSAAAASATVGTVTPHVRAAEARASAALLQDLSIRAAELDQREQAIRQRERELAEQRRILAEEYRLLRSRTASTPHGYTPPQNVRVQVQAPLRVDDDRHVSVWQRFKRMMLGTSSPAME
ncbi:MAG TPA: XrtA/PEP-CTERM system-associated ATPase [Vicinamibacterales bacterium]|nr:XrtA/PEP-CTERM system-associated ATPase [Vicinamibacterales bacterium]